MLKTKNNDEIELAKFELVMDLTLLRVRQELKRQLILQQEGRFERACTHPNHTDESNFAICMEEYHEVFEETIKMMGDMNRSVLGVTKAMQSENKSQKRLEEEILQTSATFVGWLISRERSNRANPKE